MENASKALIIAGSVLISIVLITLGVVVFRRMANTTIIESNLTEQQISAFNSKISPYIGENISGSQVNELIQRAITINKKAENDQDESKIIYINNSKEFSRVTTGVYYKVTGNVNEKGLLTIITIERNN